MGGNGRTDPVFHASVVRFRRYEGRRRVPAGIHGRGRRAFHLRGVPEAMPTQATAKTSTKIYTLQGSLLEARSCRRLCRYWIGDDKLALIGGKATSRVGIGNQYENLRGALKPNAVVELDSVRLLMESQKQQIGDPWKSISGVCQQTVDVEEEEFDHLPIPCRDGGPICGRKREAGSRPMPSSLAPD